MEVGTARAVRIFKTYGADAVHQFSKPCREPRTMRCEIHSMRVAEATKRQCHVNAEGLVRGTRYQCCHDDARGLDAVSARKKRATPPIQPIFDGERQAQLIAFACSKPPPGYARWTWGWIEVVIAMGHGRMHERIGLAGVPRYAFFPA
jgi:hypothetical protein